MTLKVRYDSSVDDTVHGAQMDNLQRYCTLVPLPPTFLLFGLMLTVALTLTVTLGGTNVQ